MQEVGSGSRTMVSWRRRNRDDSGTILGLTLVLIITAVNKVKANNEHHFLASVDRVLQDLVIDAFWTQGRFYNMSTTSKQSMFSLFYAKPVDPTDPTGVYNKMAKRDLPMIYQSAPPSVPCQNAASTSIISGAKAVDFAAFTIGIMTLVININNNINNNNNNNNDINLNSITQDSNSVVSNSDNMNSIMAEILPIPVGKRRKRFITYDIKQELNDFMAKYAQDPSCEQYIVCSALEQLRENIELLDVVIGKTRLNAADCASLFPECKYSAKYY